MPACSDGRTCGAPLTVIVPEVQRSRPAIRRNRVVLPHPEAPTTVTNSPGLTTRSVLWSACTGSPDAVANTVVTRDSSMAGTGSRRRTTLCIGLPPRRRQRALGACDSCGERGPACKIHILNKAAGHSQTPGPWTARRHRMQGADQHLQWYYY